MNERDATREQKLTQQAIAAKQDDFRSPAKMHQMAKYSQKLYIFRLTSVPMVLALLAVLSKVRHSWAGTRFGRAVLMHLGAEQNHLGQLGAIHSLRLTCA